MTIDSDYKGTTMGFLMGAAGTAHSQLTVPRPLLGDPGPMDQFEVWAGTLMAREARTDGLAVFVALRRLP